MPASARNRFDGAALTQVDEPVRRYLTHALRDGGALHEHVELAMAGRIKVGTWLGFSARQEFHGHDWEYQ